VRIGTAGWAIPRAHAHAFPQEGSGLQRYAARLDAAEINSTFYRSHRPATFVRWRDATPEGFRFSVKLPRAITHEAKLACGADAVDDFLRQVAELGEKLGALLVQLPPSLAYEAATADLFFTALVARAPVPVVCEPRHVSWFEPQADAQLASLRVARAAADPLRHPDAMQPGGWRDLAYWRLHGSPRMYRSAYEDPALEALVRAIRQSSAAQAWVVFDNTTSGAATADALRLKARLRD
jgi:uncharacterized protein YecE (DUF72 family)